MANSVDSNKMTRYEPSHLDLHCLQRSDGLKGFTLKEVQVIEK